ncbi:hypothetical protein DPMN_085516 [Dreissena polymorpha]|uniref:Uncharacterized protein n=1 Tax=Dreissena polymorpha TaxID=45954 RepID=A0A9D4BM01_DREPO|nr:hypothetical protein DPMN_085516 [Dreissena polymorpha]
MALSSCYNLEWLILEYGVTLHPNITLTGVTCSSTWLCNLFNALLALDHEVECKLKNCQITSSEEGAVLSSFKREYAAITTDIIKITTDGYDFPGLWEAVHGLRIKCLSLCNGDVSFKSINGTSFSQSLRSFSLLETLTMQLEIYIDLQLPQSLKHVTLFYDILSSL